MLIILLVYKEIYFNTNNLDSFIPSVVISFLQDFKDDIYRTIKFGSELNLFCSATLW
jgi:hypothetical protein